MFALYAFNLEVARIRELARGPLAGEIRLQWWSDVLAGERHGEWQGHPVAAALTATIEAYGLTRSRFAKLVDARRFDLYTDAMQTLADLEAYADAVSTTLIMLSAQILAAGREADIGEVAHHAGVAYAIAGLLNAFPIHARQGQLFVPIEVLQRHGADRQALAAGPARAALKSRPLPSCGASRADILIGRRTWCEPYLLRCCRRCCRLRLRRRCWPAWSERAMIPSLQSRSRPGGGNGSSGVLPTVPAACLRSPDGVKRHPGQWASPATPDFAAAQSGLRKTGASQNENRSRKLRRSATMLAIKARSRSSVTRASI